MNTTQRQHTLVTGRCAQNFHQGARSEGEHFSADTAMIETDSNPAPDSADHGSCAVAACSAVPVIVDPEYSRFIVIARLSAKEGGYALAIHGSLNRDLDLIAIPWVETCNTPEHLVQRIEYRTGCKTNGHPMQIREHGRLSVVFMIAQTFGDPRYVDFSIIPPKQNK